ncbi:MAG: response regulator [bacterium]|nr:response regulator [bacterium]
MDAFEMFRSQPAAFDLVITDMTMPRMTGDTFALRLMEIRPELPVFICTGFSHIIDEEKAKSIGIMEYLTKPIRKAHLAKITRSALDEAKEKNKPK